MRGVANGRSSRENVAARTPSWFQVLRNSALSTEGAARIPGTPWADTGLLLIIREDPGPERLARVLRVREALPGSNLPRYCPERHVNPNSTFCLGLDMAPIKSEDDAEPWWKLLRQFIECQGVAQRTGIWPMRFALDHGEAGKHHQAALQIAEKLEITEEYLSAYLGDSSWIHDFNLRMVDKKNQLINGRARCPRRCLGRCRGNNHGKRPLLRRECLCRLDIARLMQEEHSRLEKLRIYWRDAVNGGLVCCGQMKNCPIKPTI
jgi:hypothetical protein